MKLMLGGLFVAVVAALLASTWTNAERATPSDYRGVYVTSRQIRDAGDVQPATDLILPAASGVFVRLAWSVLEPRRQAYDWSAFDRIVIPAVKAAKQIEVGVIAGSYAPTWLGESEGVKFIDFPIAQRNTCLQGRIYLPWQTAYQTAYLTMMKALKAHLQSIGAYDNLRIVKMSFIAQQTLELRLPRRRAGVYNGCPLSDAPQAWIKAGYRPRLIEDSYRRVINSLAHEVFVGKTISQAVQRGDSFPDVDDNGRVVPDGVADAPLVTSLIRTCIEVAGSRCAIQHQSLQTLGPLGDRVLSAKTAGAVIGWQTALNRGRARCQKDQAVARRNVRRAPRVACTSESYARVLERATDAGATYLELWPDDVRDFPDVVRGVEKVMDTTPLPRSNR